MKHSRVVRADERGFMMVIVVIMVILTIISSATALIIWAHKVEAERLQKAYGARILELENDIGRENLKKSPMGQGTGQATQGDSALGVIKAKSKEFLEEKQDELVRKHIESIFKSLEKLPKEGGEDWFVIKQKAHGLENPLTKEDLLELLPVHTSIRSLYPILFQKVKNRQLIRDQLAQEKAFLEYRRDQIQSITAGCKQKKDDQADEVRKKADEVKRKIDAFLERAAQVRQRYDDEAEEAENAIAAEAEEIEEWRILITNQIRELERQIAELKRKEKIRKGVTVSFGRLMDPDIFNRRGAIDLGSRERIKSGMKFLVGRRGKSGKFEYKGEIEVKKVWLTHSEVIINKVYSNDRPLVDGDPIINPLYNPRRPVVVALAGGEKLIGRKFPSKTEVKNRMLEMGVDVREKCDLDVDFVVRLQLKPEGKEWASAVYPVYKRANRLDMTILEHEEIFLLLGD